LACQQALAFAAALALPTEVLAVAALRAEIIDLDFGGTIAETGTVLVVLVIADRAICSHTWVR